MERDSFATSNYSCVCNMCTLGLDMSGGNCTLSDQLLVAVLLLLNKEVSEHGRHLVQYFHLFHLYASLGPAEKLQLLKVCPPLVIW